MDRIATTRLGRTKLEVTRLGLGSAPLGGLYTAVSEAEAAATITRAYEVGIRLFDTAPLYGSGLAEQRIGHILGQQPRESFVLATKVGRLLRPPGGGAGPVAAGLAAYETATGLVPQFDFSYDGVMRSHEESLQRLVLDRVDILHIHDPDLHHDEAIAGAFKALNDLRSEGTIGAVGAGMNQVEMLTRFAREAPFDCFLVAGRYTLLDQSAVTELLPACQELGIGVILGGVFNSGILANPEAVAPPFNYRPAERTWIEKALRLQTVCARHSVPLKAAALQFPLAHPAVTTLLLGPRSVVELEENLALLAVAIPPDLWSDLVAEGLLEEGAVLPGQDGS